MSEPIQCVGIICFRGDDVLLIQRGTAPRKGDWSIPGGRIEVGEGQIEAASRELLEETGVTASIGAKILTLPAHFEGRDYMLHDYVAQWQSGEPKAGDDAVKARFVPVTKITSLSMWVETENVITTAYEKMTSLSPARR